MILAAFLAKCAPSFFHTRSEGGIYDIGRKQGIRPSCTPCVGHTLAFCGTALPSCRSSYSRRFIEAGYWIICACENPRNRPAAEDHETCSYAFQTALSGSIHYSMTLSEPKRTRQPPLACKLCIQTTASSFVLVVPVDLAPEPRKTCQVVFADLQKLRFKPIRPTPSFCSSTRLLDRKTLTKRRRMHACIFCMTALF